MTTLTFSPVVFCGPSGVGKGTLIELLRKRFPDDQFGFSVSNTTRNPRDGEIDGVHYHFTTVESMQQEIAAGNFIEFAEVHGKYYGTSVHAVESVQSTGKICILDIDVQGVRNVKKSTLECKYVFIAPPSMDALEARLRGRGTEKEDDIKTRLENALAELDYGMGEGNFDIVLKNDDLDKTFENLCKIMMTWYPHLSSAFCPRPVVFCGPSGVGKGTLIQMLMNRFPNDQFGFSVSHTTRQPREGEENGIQYNFTTVESMKKEIEEGKFIEHAEVHGNFYGTR
jgi:guanylate kinase